MAAAVTEESDVLHKETYPPGSRAVVVPLASGGMMVVVSKRRREKVPLDRASEKKP